MLLNDDGVIHSERIEKHELQSLDLDAELQLKILKGFITFD